MSRDLGKRERPRSVPEGRPCILVTNDDGIHAPGIRVLAAALRRLGEVVVVAPDGERSSVGHGITLAHPLWCRRIDEGRGFQGYAVTGTPADCVKFAVAVLLRRRPRMVVSGVNDGRNDGCSVFYSGTVAAAREGALMGIPSLAVSLTVGDHADMGFAARTAARLAKRLLRTDLPRGTFLNVNVPACPARRVRGIRVTRQGTAPIHGVFQKRRDPALRDYYWMTGREITAEIDPRSDTACLRRGYVTVTPIRCDLTDEAAMEALAGWGREGPS